MPPWLGGPGPSGPLEIASAQMAHLTGCPVPGLPRSCSRTPTGMARVFRQLAGTHQRTDQQAGLAAALEEADSRTVVHRGHEDHRHSLPGHPKAPRARRGTTSPTGMSSPCPGRPGHHRSAVTRSSTTATRPSGAPRTRRGIGEKVKNAEKALA